MNNEVLDTWLNLLRRHQSNIILVILTAGMLTTLAMQSHNMFRVINDTPESLINTSEGRRAEKSFSLSDFSFLFGESTGVDKQQTVREIPRTSLNLTLRGALAGNETSDSSAIIQDSNGQEHFYRIGDSLPGGAVLDQVYPHHVVIRHQGTLQKLAFPELAADKELTSTTYPQTPYIPREIPGLSDEYQENARALEDRMEQLRQRLQQAQEN